jgi:HlyD family secretion protein
LNNSRRHRLAFVLVGFAGLLVLNLGRNVVAGRFERQRPSDVILLSGNVEAHESQLSLKGVQSPVVELPFEEGQAVHEGASSCRWTARISASRWPSPRRQ